MPEFGYASKYSPVGWKATIPDISDTCDVVAVYGDTIYEFNYETRTDGTLCLALKSGRAKQIPVNLPQTQPLGEFNTSEGVTNEKTGFIHIKYYKSPTTTNVLLFSPTPRTYYCKELPPDATYGVFPDFIHTTEHMYEDQYFNRRPIRADGILAPNTYGTDVINVLGMTASIPSEIAYTTSLSRVNPLSAGLNIPATYVKSCATLGVSTTNNYVYVKNMPRRFNEVDTYPVLGNWQDVPRWVWWMPVDGTERRAQLIEFACYVELTGITNEVNATYPTNPASQTDPGFTSTTVGYANIKISSEIYVDGEKITLPSAQSATAYVAYSPRWESIGNGSLVVAKQKPRVSMGKSGSSVIWDIHAYHHISSDLLVLEGFNKVTPLNGIIARSLAPSTTDWYWNSYGPYWDTAYAQYSALYPVSVTMPSSYVVINLKTKEVVHSGSSLLIGSSFMTTIPMVDAIMSASSGATISFNRYGNPNTQTISFSDLDSRSFTGVGNNFVSCVNYIEYPTQGQPNPPSLRTVFKTQYGIFVSDTDADTAVTTGILSQATQIPFVAEDKQGNRTNISIPYTAHILDLKSNGLYMNRLIEDPTETSTIYIQRWY